MGASGQRVGFYCRVKREEAQAVSRAGSRHQWLRYDEHGHHIGSVRHNGVNGQSQIVSARKMTVAQVCVKGVAYGFAAGAKAMGRSKS